MKKQNRTKKTNRDWSTASYEELALAAKRSPEAMEILLARLRPLMLDFAASRGVRDVADAEDLVQHTLIRVIEHIESFDATRAKFTTWVSTILVRLLSNSRRDMRRRSATLEEYGGHIVAEMRMRAREQAARPDVELDARRLDERIRRAIEKLSHRHRDVVTMALQEYTHQEIADACGIAVGTAKSRKHRGLKHLAELLELS